MVTFINPHGAKRQQTFDPLPCTACEFWLVDAVSKQLLSRDNVYGLMNGCNMAVKQIQKGLSGLHLISRMLKVRLKQICAKCGKYKIKQIQFRSAVA